MLYPILSWTRQLLTRLTVVILVLFACSPEYGYARSAVTPWTSELSFQNLVYGASTNADVIQILGKYPDEIIRTEQMTPVIENYYYYDTNGSGAATVFVFENNFLVGLHYKSPSNQFIDLTYFLPNNGDRWINLPTMGNIRGYYPNLPMFGW